MAARTALAVHMARVLPATRCAVFDAMTHADDLARWWGPRGYTAPSVEVDPQVGGGYRIAMQPPAGDTLHVSGRYREVERPGRLVYTFNWDAPASGDRETTVTVSLSALGDETELVVDQGPFANEGALALHEQGWSQALDRLQDLLAG